MNEEQFPELVQVFEISTQDQRDAFMISLRKRIEYLLNYDNEKLWWILYRIDVPEPLARKAFDESSIEGIAAVLSELIVGREIEKYKSRKKSRGDWLDA